MTLLELLQLTKCAEPVGFPRSTYLTGLHESFITCAFSTGAYGGVVPVAIVAVFLALARFVQKLQAFYKNP